MNNAITEIGDWKPHAKELNYKVFSYHVKNKIKLKELNVRSEIMKLQKQNIGRIVF